MHEQDQIEVTYSRRLRDIAQLWVGDFDEVIANFPGESGEKALCDFFASFNTASDRVWLLVDALHPIGLVMTGDARVVTKDNSRMCSWIRQRKFEKVRISAYNDTIWSFVEHSHLVELSCAPDIETLVSALWMCGFVIMYPREGADLEGFSEDLSRIDAPEDVDNMILDRCHTEIFTGDDREIFLVLSTLPDARERAEKGANWVNDRYAELVKGSTKVEREE